MKIAVVVPGRFHAFDLAIGLLSQGHDVKVFTNYPAWAIKRFGLTEANTQRFWLHGVLSRASDKLPERTIVFNREAWLTTMFSRWARNELLREAWDVVHVWSGFAEEFLNVRTRKQGLSVIMRGSAHICAQARLLEEEERRTSRLQQRPSPWIIAREQREYMAADRIMVLSTFAYGSFAAEGVPQEKLDILPLGAELGMFRAGPKVYEARRQRLLSGAPLRVLYVGAFSFRKGIWDLVSIIRELNLSNFQFCLVGPEMGETAELIDSIRTRARIISKRRQSELPELYAWADVFVFPTIEDGFAIVLAQAAAAGLPILTTTNSAGPDLIQEGENGWVLPVRTPKAFVDRLRWCDQHRSELSEMTHRISVGFQPHGWREVALNFEDLYCKYVG